MPEDKTTDKFQALQKQMAKDALERALKELHSEISRDIERNKTAFSEEIKKTLAGFKKNLEQSVAEEMERQLSALFDKHFQNTNAQIKSGFQEMLSPVLEKIKEEMKTLHTQGETTLQTWKEVVSLYTHFWVKPAFIWMSIAILTGTTISILSSYLWGSFTQRARQSCEDTLQWYANEYFAMKKAATSAGDTKKDPEKDKQTQTKKKLK